MQSSVKIAPLSSGIFERVGTYLDKYQLANTYGLIILTNITPLQVLMYLISALKKSSAFVSMELGL